MINKEFFNLPENEVQFFIKNNNEQCFESWLLGYLYLTAVIKKSIQSNSQINFIQKMEQITSQNLEVFKSKINS